MNGRVTGIATAVIGIAAGLAVTAAPATTIRSALIDADAVGLAQLKVSDDPAVVTALNQLTDQMFVDQTPVILGQGREHSQSEPA
jgi:hypothetical protein